MCYACYLAVAFHQGVRSSETHSLSSLLDCRCGYCIQMLRSEPSYTHEDISRPNNGKPPRRRVLTRVASHHSGVSFPFIFLVSYYGSRQVEMDLSVSGYVRITCHPCSAATHVGPLVVQSKPRVRDINGAMSMAKHVHY